MISILVFFYILTSVLSAGSEKLRIVCISKLILYIHASHALQYYNLLKTKGKYHLHPSFRNSRAVQKCAKVGETLAPLAVCLMHVIALAIRPPCMTSRLNDRLIHLWV